MYMCRCTFFNRVKKLASEHQMSMNELERELCLPRNALSNYKKGGNPSAIRALKVAEFFGVSMEWLLGVTNDLPNVNIEKFFEALSDAEKRELFYICQEWLLSTLDEINAENKKVSMRKG